MRVRAGEVVVLLGPNGAGKTTTLRILAGVISPGAGAGVVAGVPLDAGSLQDLRARVGLLTETPGLWDRLPVRDNLLTYARLYGVANPAARVEALLDRLGLTARGADAAGTLSKGLRQRVALARALLPEPQAAAARRADLRTRSRRGAHGARRGQRRAGARRRGGAVHPPAR